jgi:hypothetical protein
MNLKELKKTNNNESSPVSNGNIEVIDIQDIVPHNGNALFLCIARSIIYMVHRDPILMQGLEHCLNLRRDDFSNDVKLQALIRCRLCEFWCENVTYDDQIKSLRMTHEYETHFKGNIFEFLIQVYQSSVNNITENELMAKFGLKDLSSLLNMKIYVRTVDNKWNVLSPKKIKSSVNPCIDYIKSSYSIFILEYMSKSEKSYRLLLPRQQWFSNHKFPNNIKYNEKICSFYFTQFNHDDELKAYERPYLTMNLRLLMDLFNSVDKNLINQVFCVFINSISLKLLINCNKYNLNGNSSLSYSFSEDTVAIGRKFFKASLSNKDDLYDFLNFLFGKRVFCDEFVLNSYASMRSKNF